MEGKVKRTLGDEKWIKESGRGLRQVLQAGCM